MGGDAISSLQPPATSASAVNGLLANLKSKSMFLNPMASLTNEPNLPPPIQKLILMLVAQQANAKSNGSKESALQKPDDVNTMTPKSKPIPQTQHKMPPRPKTPQAPHKKAPKRKIAFRPDSPPIRSHFITRHNTPPAMQPIKRVLTPDWVQETESSPNPLDGTDTSTFNFDIIDAHRKIEVYECRITYGDDAQHVHPALARELAMEDLPTVFTREESERYENYEEHPFLRRTPLFWTERVWDTPQSMMTMEESDALQAEIEQVTNIVIVPKPVKAPPSPRPRGRRPQSRGQMLNLPIGFFDTDPEDETDWDTDL